MKIPKNKKSKRKVLIIATSIALVIPALAVYLLWERQDNGATTGSRSDTSQSKKLNQKDSSAEKDTRQKSDKSDENATQSTPQPPVEKEKETTPQYEGSDPNTTQSLTGAITYSAVAGDKLVIRTNINQSLGSGTCELTLSQDTKTVAKTAETTLNPSSSTCQGFDIPVSELGGGKWHLSIKVNGDGKTGTLTGNANI